MNKSLEQNIEANNEKNSFKQSLELVIKGKKIAVEYIKKFEGKDASINNDYQYYENLAVNSIVELIKNKQVKKVLLHNNSKTVGFFRDTVFKISEATRMRAIDRTADQFELVEGSQ